MRRLLPWRASGGKSCGTIPASLRVAPVEYAQRNGVQAVAALVPGLGPALGLSLGLSHLPLAWQPGSWRLRLGPAFLIDRRNLLAFASWANVCGRAPVVLVHSNCRPLEIKPQPLRMHVEIDYAPY